LNPKPVSPEIADEVRRKYPILFLQMNETQSKFIRVKNSKGKTPRRRILESGNKNGKTFCGIAEDIAHMQGFRPWLKKDDPDYRIDIKVPNVGLIVGETVMHSIAEKIVPTLKELIPDYCRAVFKAGPTGVPIKVTLTLDTTGKKCGSECYLRCFDDQTEVLTNVGWKYFKDLDRTERVMTLNIKTNYIEWDKPSAFFSAAYKGKMFQGKAGVIDYCVTPTHNMVVVKSSGSKRHEHLYIKPVIELVKYDCVPRSFLWKGTPVETFEVPFGFPEKRKGAYKLLNIPCDVWVAFLGIFLAEGHAGKTSVDISQYNGYKKDKIRKLLQTLPFKFSDEEKCFRIHNTVFAKYMQQYGKSGNKYIPEVIKELPSTALCILIEWMMLGDGGVWKKDLGNGTISISQNYTSKSKRLVDDFQEVLLKIGSDGWVFKPAMSDFYRVNIHKNKKVSLKYTKNTPNIINEIDYDGMVYCVTTNNHTVMTRRNGRTLITGNSYDQRADTFEGIDFMYLHCDEPPPEDVLLAIERGKVVTNAPSWYTMTPLKEPFFYTKFSSRAGIRI
jgi:hypothetical protein